MINIKRILFPTDFSENSKHALRYACELAHQFQAELHVLSVVQDIALVLPESGAMYSLPPINMDEAVKSAEEALRGVIPPDWAKEHTVVLTACTGAPFLEILRYAKEKEVDLIVLGTHGRTGLSHVLLGSVAERVVRSAPCPVLTVRPDGHEFVMP